VKGLIGFIDKNGKMVIPPQFGQSGGFREGLAAVEVLEDGKRDWSRPQKFGFIDRGGALAIAAKYRVANNFSEGLAAVETSAGRSGFIDKSGEMVIPPIRCELAGDFSGGVALIQRENGAVGYIN